MLHNFIKCDFQQIFQQIFKYLHILANSTSFLLIKIINSFHLQKVQYVSNFPLYSLHSYFKQNLSKAKKHLTVHLPYFPYVDFTISNTQVTPLFNSNAKAMGVRGVPATFSAGDSYARNYPQESLVFTLRMAGPEHKQN